LTAELNYYTEEELAALLKVPRKTVARWRATGTGPKWVRAGRYVRYEESAVRDWNADQQERNSRESA
jgi:predicted DNA-binding transcriptional regulator AlpA